MPEQPQSRYQICATVKGSGRMTLLLTAVTRLNVAAILSNTATSFRGKILGIGWLLFEM